ncbi:MAG: OstA-like protein [Chitinophagaceae bacterium]
MKQFVLIILALITFTVRYNTVIAQAPITTSVTDSGKQGKIIRIIAADRLNFFQPDSLNEFQSAAGKVRIQQGNTLFDCDSVVLNKTLNMLEAFGKVHINDADSVHTYADYVRYLGKEKKAYLNNNVRLTDGRGVLTTNELEYDVNTKLGIYKNGGKVVNGKTVLTSEQGWYYGETRDVYFKRKVRLRDPQYNINTDTLLYNTYAELATFVVPTTIATKTQKIFTKDGYYDLKNKKAYFGKRPIIQDGSTTLIADEFASDDTSGFSEARGNVIITDTAQGTQLYANNVKANKKAGSLLATESPVAVIKQENDSIFIAADTIFSSKLSDLIAERAVRNLLFTDSIAWLDAKEVAIDSNRNRYLEAYYNVRIFSDSLQAVGDSMLYNLYDSVFRLFKNPIAWAQENQISGDTMYLFTKNQKPHQILIYENALTINDANNGFLNQVRGRLITGYFIDGEINFLRAKGGAETVYYPLDKDNKYIGVNRATADALEMYFENKKLQKIKAITELKGKMYPINQANHEALKLRGATLLINKRPKSKYALFGE